jgi:N6-L-threonylcarbamoyladenine synthase
MKILGIETSCDETAAAVVANGRQVLSNVVASQIDIHAAYGGVVPEIAARSHIEVILPVIEQALRQAGTTWDDIGGIAVTAGPGLLGSLLVGTLTAATLARVHAKPLYAVNHVVAHTFANFLTVNEPRFPLLGLSVSGGHSHLIWFESPLKYELLGRTRDDAAGEAFDKVAKMMGLPYPGGPSIGKLAPSGDEHAYELPTAKLGDSLDFSFSGLKTAVLRQLQSAVGRDYRLPSSELPHLLSTKQKADMAASFQRRVCETLAGRLREAYDQRNPASVVIAGGVAANNRLREEVNRQLPLKMHYADMAYCTDNGAMIASMGFFLAEAGRNTLPESLHANPGLQV